MKRKPLGKAKSNLTHYNQRTGQYRSLEPAPITLSGPEWSWPSKRANDSGRAA